MKRKFKLTSLVEGTLQSVVDVALLRHFRQLAPQPMFTLYTVFERTL